MHVIIGSKNPVKKEATELGFQKMFPEATFTFEGVDAPSGIADQPMTSDDTLQGAKNRAEHCKEQYPKADFWIGLEGGCERDGNDMQAFAWIYILSKNQSGKGKTGTFFLPKAVIDLMDQGYELGEADDIVFHRQNSKQGDGAVGILTNTVYTRATYYAEAVIFALIPFVQEELY